MKKKEQQLKKVFGDNGYNLADIPHKIGNVFMSRVLNANLFLLGTMTFPHGADVVNNKWQKDMKCWKRYRKKQYRISLGK